MKSRFWNGGSFWRGVAVVSVARLALSLSAACGGSDNAGNPTATAEPRVRATASADTTPRVEPPSGSVAIDEAFWHAGWKVTLGEAEIGTSDDRGYVTIDATFENLGTVTDKFASELVLNSGTTNYTSLAPLYDVPRVPGKSKGTGTIAIYIDDAFSLNHATLIIGDPVYNQAIVPIGAESEQKLVSLKPVNYPITGRIEAGEAFVLRVTGAELRADIAGGSDHHTEVEAGKLALTIDFDVDIISGHPGARGSFYFQPRSDVTLTLPDGTSVAASAAPASVDLDDGGTTVANQSLRFEVPADYVGSYALRVRGKFNPDGAEGEWPLPFEIAKPEGGGAAEEQRSKTSLPTPPLATPSVDGTQPSTLKDATALARALESRLGCTGFELDDEDEVTSQGECEIGAEIVSLVVFDPAFRDTLFAGMRGVFCGVGLARFAYAEGANWIAVPGSRETAEAIATTVSGELKVENC